MTFCIMTQSIMTISLLKLGVMTLSIITLGINTLVIMKPRKITLGLINTRHYNN